METGAVVSTGISMVLGMLAPFVIKFLRGAGIKGVGLLWVLYAISAAIGVGVLAMSGNLDLSNASVTVGAVVASAQTVYQLFKDKLKVE